MKYILSCALRVIPLVAIFAMFFSGRLANAGAQKLRQDRAHYVASLLPTNSDWYRGEDGFLWQSNSPLDLISTLTTNRQKGIFLQTINGTHYKWVKEEDIDHLVSLLESKDPCSRVVSSSHIGLTSISSRRGSTVGDEALHLIIAFWYGFYPVRANGDDLPATKDEAKKWYQIWRLQPTNAPVYIFSQ